MKTRSRTKKRFKKRAIANMEHQYSFVSNSLSEKSEDEANRTADIVASDVNKNIQRNELPESGSSRKTDLIESETGKQSGSGHPLSKNTRSFMENRMGYDFRNVSIHNNQQATFLNRKLNAQAFTYGSDIYFGRGKYNPSTTQGKHLLAHELTHVVQQTKNPFLQKMRIQRQTEKPEWKKAEEKFKAVVVSLDPKNPKSNGEKFKSAVDKSLGTLGKKKVRDSIFKKLKLNPNGKKLLSILGMSGYTLYSLSKKKVPTLALDIKLKPNTWLTVSTGGDFKKPKAMVGVKIRF